MRASTAVNFEHVDVLVVGAGLTGIGMGYHLTTQQPGKTYAIVDSRDGIGGTWDLFRYPGIRSDADLHTFGFGFKPWTSDDAIADGDESLDYLQETIDENDLGPHIHLGHKVIRAHFSSEEARWTVTLGRTSDGEQFAVCCNMLFSAAGYYDVDHGYTPHFEGREDFSGSIVHPQHWPADLDCAGKKVVVIGSGATAVTLIPAMTEKAGHVTMLQRSPSYVMPAPRQDPDRQHAAPTAAGLRRVRDHPEDQHQQAAAAVRRQQTLSQADAQADPQGQPRSTPGGLRRRHPLQPDLRAMGPAPLPRPGRRHV